MEVKILKVDTDSRKIGLSLRRVQWAAEEETTEEPAAKKHVPEGPEKVLSDDAVEKIKKAKQKKSDESSIQEAKPEGDTVL